MIIGFLSVCQNTWRKKNIVEEPNQEEQHKCERLFMGGGRGMLKVLELLRKNL
jgi:hypothetical protein